ncbi:MAG: sulfurtransferase-like selenium metabolism protein YedF [Deltaproteobacteria bacterium]|nr:sulfurtransferase-like selenium metabolism protein YedF [Deltaproteobacteria bacterium]MBT4526240.1 sulfurtransferase-like selenium metabolism protein YedF [Deltaproteobacteria bacterium]
MINTIKKRISNMEHKQIDNQKTLILISNDRIGQGDDELGLKLMANFLGNLKEMGSDLWQLLFLNSAVKLTTEGSKTLKALQNLESEGVILTVCTTCLNHYDLLDKKQVGTATTMPDIISALQFADKVITL